MPSSQQSPINLQDPIFANLGERELVRSWDNPVFGKVVQHGDAVKIDIQHDGNHFITLDRKRFHLTGYHFHHPCEHWFNGEQRILELHAVHQNINDGTYAVVALTFSLDESSNTKKGKKSLPKGSSDPLHEFIAKVAEILGAPNPETVDRRISTTPAIFLPPHPEHYYRYEGSLTTPQSDGTTYLETVSWVVMKNARLVPKNLLNQLIKEFKEPARFLQPLNRRFILATFPPVEGE